MLQPLTTYLFYEVGNYRTGQTEAVGTVKICVAVNGDQEMMMGPCNGDKKVEHYKMTSLPLKYALFQD